MKDLKIAVRLTIVCLIFFSGIYTISVWGIAQAAPNRGKGEVIVHHGQPQYSNVGQLFDNDAYFWSRPSAVGYNAAGSGGSNKGPANPDHLQTVQARIDTFLVHNPTIAKEDIPADIVTASGSGLDPHISPQAARVQVARIAKARNINPENVKTLVAQYTEEPLWGIFGTEKVNVLKLNAALDNYNQPR